jgi:hypothetical protein
MQRRHDLIGPRGPELWSSQFPAFAKKTRLKLVAGDREKMDPMTGVWTVTKASTVMRTTCQFLVLGTAVIGGHPLQRVGRMATTMEQIASPIGTSCNARSLVATTNGMLSRRSIDPHPMGCLQL